MYNTIRRANGSVRPVPGWSSSSANSTSTSGT
jgi:hypothetical protein